MTNTPIKTLAVEEAAGYRRPLDRGLLRPKAPALADPRFRGRAIPEHVMPYVKGQTRVHEAPQGCFLLFQPKRGSSTDFETWLLRPDQKPEKLDVPLIWWPFAHDWSDDATRLYLCCQRSLRCVDARTLAAHSVKEMPGAGQRVSSVAAPGGLIAAEDSERFTVWTQSGEDEVLSEPGMEGIVAAVHARRLLVQSSPRATRVYAVRSTDIVQVAAHRAALRDCWDEDGRTWANESLRAEDPPASLEESTRTVELVGLDALYPSDWS